MGVTLNTNHSIDNTMTHTINKHKDLALVRKLTVRFPERTFKRLSAVAASNGMPVATVVRVWVTQRLNKGGDDLTSDVKGRS